jgi:hypothetical protein
MNAQAQRIAIAEACGIRCAVNPHSGNVLLLLPAPAGESGFRFGQPIPDYLNDLNAMQVAESSLTDEQHSAFRMHLAGVVGERESPAYSTPGWRRRYVSSTAAQRAEAFLRTIHKWRAKQ